MPTQRFTLIVEGADLQSEPLIDELFEAGCDDATFGQSNGVQYADFDREASSLGAAILSAVRDLEQFEGVHVTGIVDIDSAPATAAAVRKRFARADAGALGTLGAHTGSGPSPGVEIPQPDWSAALVRLRASLPHRARANASASDVIVRAVRAHLADDIIKSQVTSGPVTAPLADAWPSTTMVALPSS